MTLEVLSRLPEGPTDKPPLLFVHGAWLAAWCWDEYFLPYFAALGYPAHALSFRGHGNSSGLVQAADLSHYVADLTEVVARLPAPPVLIGHSMGGGVVQKYLETHAAPGAILFASMPPYGMAASFMEAWRRHPLRWFNANVTMNSKYLFDSPELCREFFFSRDTSDAELAHFAGRVSDESYRALFDMTLTNYIDPDRVKTPLLVMGGEKDIVIPPRDVLETGRRYKARAQVLPGVAHAGMLDANWRVPAEAIVDWLSGRSGL
jgi:pimeloyl-ACP methyl ester carboxylesterase